MLRLKIGLFTVFWLIMSSQAIFSQDDERDDHVQIDIQTEIASRDGSTRSNETLPIVVIEGKPKSSVKTIRLSFSEERGELIKGLRATVDSQHEGYMDSDLSARVPFYKEGQKFTILLYSHNFDPSDRHAMRELRHSNAGSMSRKKLFRYYAKARAHAEYVINNITARSAVERPEVYAIFHFLQAARELAYKYGIIADEIVNEALQWLVTAKRYNSNVVFNSVTELATTQIIDQVKQLRGAELDRIWDNLAPLYASRMEYFCPLARSLQDLFLSLPADERKLINSSTRLLPLVADGVGECLWRAAIGVNYRNAFEGQNAEEVIRRQLGILQDAESVARDAGWTKLISMIERKQVDLRDVLPTLNSAN